MFSSFRSRKEARRYAIAWLASVGFLFIGEYSMSIVLHIGDWYIYTYDPFYLNSIFLPNGHTIADYCFDLSNVPIMIMSVWITVKALAGYGLYILRFPATFVIDWVLTCCFYVFRDIKQYDAGETNIIFVSFCVAIVQLLIYKYRCRIVQYLIRFR